jgi:hypothetical protein
LAEPVGDLAAPGTCSARSLALGEPMVGTASVVRAWLLVEQPGPWGAEALTSSRLDPRLGAALARAGQRAGVRVLLVRRPGRTPDDGWRRQGFLVHSGAGARWVERLAPADPAELLDIDLRALRGRRPPGIGAAVADPLLLVCTNGRHDRCCADYGRPLATALAAGPHAALVWESSHIGGDRFAGNLVCLPHGLYFGRVGPAKAAAVAGAYVAGRVDLEHYRGRSCYDMPVQAAEEAVRRRWGLTGLDDLRLTAREPLGPGQILTRWAAPVGTYVARVRTVDARPRRLTCHSADEIAPARHEIVELRRVAPRRSTPLQ